MLLSVSKSTSTMSLAFIQHFDQYLNSIQEDYSCVMDAAKPAENYIWRQQLQYEQAHKACKIWGCDLWDLWHFATYSVFCLMFED